MNLDRKIFGKLVAEFIGTFTLSAVVISVVNSQIGLPFFVGIGAAVVMATAVTTIGSISGAHINPAVTIGMFSTRRINAVNGLLYIVAQIAGGLAAWSVLNYLTDSQLGQTMAQSNFEGAYDARILIAEAIGAFIFGFGIAAVLNQKLEGQQAAAGIGFSLYIGILIASMASSAILNPAVAMALQTFNVNYALGPILGVLLGMNVQNLMANPPRIRRALAAAEGQAAKKRPAAKKKK